MNILGVRILALGMLMGILTGCSASSGMPTGQSASTPHPQTAHVRPATACPASGINFGVGDNGTYTVAINATCEIIAPPTITCNASQDGYTFDPFTFTGGSTHGTLTQTGRDATFKRTSSGEVDIGLPAFVTYFFQNCRPPHSITYGTITFTTP
jgi:hypothetical protein